MCCYLYSKETKIEIDYINERIVTFRNGSSVTVVDALLSNVGESKTSSIYILYPNRFERLIPFTKYKAGIQPNSFFDLGYTFFEKKHIYNKMYVKRNYDYQTTSNSLEMRVPEFFSSLKAKMKINYIPLNGKIEKNNENLLEIVAMNSDEDVILRDIDYTIFKKSFVNDLKKGEKIWIRLAFSPLQVVKNYPRWGIRKGLSFFDELRYHYEICGPDEVCHRILEKLDLSRIAIDNSDRNKDEKEDYIRNLEFIRQTISDDINNSSTKINKASLRIYPRSLRLFTDIYTQGIIEPQGGMPSYYHENTNTFAKILFFFKQIYRSNRVYDWSYGKHLHYGTCDFVRKCVRVEGNKRFCDDKIFCEIRDLPSFKLYFIGKSINYFYKIGLFLAICFIAAWISHPVYVAELFNSGSKTIKLILLKGALIFSATDFLSFIIKQARTPMVLKKYMITTGRFLF